MQYSNWYVSILDLDALLTGCQPSATVSFIQPHIKYTLTLMAAFIRIAIFYIGGVFVIGADHAQQHRCLHWQLG